MKIGIICAGDEELSPFLPMIKDCKTVEKAMLKFYAGRIDSIEVIALFSGVCKVNAAIGTQLLVDLFSADMIINSGTAGGMDPGLDIFDTVISTEVCYHDVAPDILTEFHPWMTDEGRQKINQEFAPLTVDMETASIAHVCYVNRIPFLSIRCITDTAEHSGLDNFDENCAKASVIAKDITVALLTEIKNSYCE